MQSNKGNSFLSYLIIYQKERPNLVTMILNLKKINNFGIFKSDSCNAEVEEFSKKNIIYGWNYTGKTTLSRIFGCLDCNSLPDSYSGSSFEIKCSNNISITNTSLSSFTYPVKVFNSDFIFENLGWNGELFDPILLLGEESIEAQNKIMSNQEIIERCNTAIREKQTSIDKINTSIKKGKTRTAKLITEVLSIVESFTAVHINQIIPQVIGNEQDHILSNSEKDKLLEKALSSSDEKLEPITKISLSGNIATSISGVQEALSETPTMSNTIEYLTNHADVARWVRDGLKINDGKDNCDFCGNEIDLKRLDNIKSHFSEDLQQHERKLNSLISKISTLKLTFTPNHEKDYYSEFRDSVKDLNNLIKDIVVKHNEQIDIVLEALEKKLESQYSAMVLASIDTNIDLEISTLITELSVLADKNDNVSDNFDTDKDDAIIKIKRHHVAKLLLDLKVEFLEKKSEILKNNITKLQLIINQLNSTNLELDAQISKAQKGREELNVYITKFLSHSNIEIEVVNINDSERFRLMRGGDIAHNLSEGEKTAVAFSFFLVKLQELSNLQDTIVYIDDPISSLDSNHLFQVNAVIKDFFFTKAQGESGQWSLDVQQIFFSTHNFEFLALLKELPMNKKADTKYYFIKRVSVDSSKFINMPSSIEKYTSEYHYLWNVIHDYYISDDKENLEVLLSLPNAVRRFIELYTYSKIPGPSRMSVDQRADLLFGAEESKRILKVLHHFSHLNNINRMSQNSDLVVDIENVVNDIVDYVKTDTLHFDALMNSISQ